MFRDMVQELIRWGKIKFLTKEESTIRVDNVRPGVDQVHVEFKVKTTAKSKALKPETIEDLDQKAMNHLYIRYGEYYAEMC